MKNTKLVHLVWPPLLIYISYLLSKLVLIDSLSTLANDSVHYLVMARHYSPWVGESRAIASAWLLQDFPPFFPWVLAFSGAAHSLLAAHILVAATGLISLYFLYLLANRWLKIPLLAIFPLLLFSLSPGFLLGLQGILSEPLYLLLVLVFLVAYNTEEQTSAGKVVLTILLLSAILLTRTTGITLLLALLAQAFFHSFSHRKLDYRPALLVTVALLLYFFLMTLWGPVRESHYLTLLIQFITGTDLYASGSDTPVRFSLLTQMNYLLQAWFSFWLIHWKYNSIPYFVILLLLLMSFSGLLLRLVKNKIDAWYALFFLLTLLVWPHPGQLFRLIFPVMPLLTIYAAYAFLQLLKINHDRSRKLTLPAALFLAALATTLPSHAFIHARLALANSMQRVPVYEMFRQARQVVATKQMLFQNQMLKDFTHITETVAEGEKVLYFKAAYVAVLSNRIGIPSPSPVEQTRYRAITEREAARYIFLTRLHPRNTNLNYTGFKGAEHLEGWTTLSWCSQLAGEGFASCLFKVNNQGASARKPLRSP